jgi:hypothetical protein
MDGKMFAGARLARACRRAHHAAWPIASASGRATPTTHAEAAAAATWRISSAAAYRSVSVQGWTYFSCNWWYDLADGVVPCRRGSAAHSSSAPSSSGLLVCGMQLSVGRMRGSRSGDVQRVARWDPSRTQAMCTCGTLSTSMLPLMQAMCWRLRWRGRGEYTMLIFLRRPSPLL